MNSMKRVYYLIFTIVLIVVLSACSEKTENEHLPSYCQTYAGFVDTTSRDMFELLDEAGYTLNRYEYLSVISEIELEFELDDPSKEIDLGGIQCFQNLTSLTLIGRSFKDISEINALSNIQFLRLENTSVVSIDSFKNLSKIKTLEISDTQTLQNVDGVGEMTKLTDLNLSNNGLVNVGELNELINLKTLDLSHNNIRHFPSINQLSNLTHLNISFNRIDTYEDLTGLDSLVEMNASNNEICDLSSLEELNSIQVLDLSFNDLGCVGVDVSPNFDSLENALFLEELYLNDNNLTSISGLKNRDISLKTLHIENNLLSDITPIGEYTNITNLVMYNNNISDINDLSGMTGLTTIDLSKNAITDFSDLLLIPNLTEVNLSENQITTIPDISTSWPNLSVLNLYSNILENTEGVSGHPTLETLILYNNGLTELGGIEDLIYLDELIIIDEAELDIPIEDQNPNEIRIIRNSYNNVPSLPLTDGEGLFDFGFELNPNGEIYNSINDINTIRSIDFTGMDIDVIDEQSINLPNIQFLRVSGNNLTDLSFIYGSPLLGGLYLSGNPVTNLSIINGNDTEFLDNLVLVEANNIENSNDLVDAFIDLPLLTVISLEGTELSSISNSFNNLERLEDLRLNSSVVESIDNSFNSIFLDSESSGNEINFTNGHIATIANSFNNGNYDSITIKNHEPLPGSLTTGISGSFNNLQINNTTGLTVTNNDFSQINSSFTDIVVLEARFNDNQTETIILSFTDSTIDILDFSVGDDLVGNDLTTINGSFTTSIIGELNLSGNELSTVENLNLVTNIEKLYLDDNQLNTVSFIDGITGLTELDISNQINELGTFNTLLTIDGINNLPLLESDGFTKDNLTVTSIDGFKNTGIEIVDFSFTTNGDILLNNVSAESFLGSPLVNINLQNQELTNIDFLDNTTGLERLIIGLDITDLSDFQSFTFNETLTNLSFSNKQKVADFSYLESYDSLEQLTVSDGSIDVLNNLDGLNSLTVLSIEEEAITSITNSFNDLSSYNISASYLEAFTSLSSINSSFDVYGLPTKVNSIDLSASITITNSFKNIEDIRINGNQFDVIPNFDIDSFDSIDLLTLEYGDYASFGFIYSYSNLESLVFENLDGSISDLTSTSISSITMEDVGLGVTGLSLLVEDNAVLDLTTQGTQTINIDSNFSNFDFDAENTNFIVSTTTSTVSLSGRTSDLTLDSPTVTSLNLSGYTGSDVVLNTKLLSEVNTPQSATVNPTSVVVNSEEISLDLELTTANLIINDDSTTNYILNVDTDITTINNIQPVITIHYTGTDLNANYNTLEDITVTGSFEELVATSDVLTNVITSSTTSTLNSSAPVMLINANDITLANNNLNNLTANTEDLTINTTNNENIAMIVVAQSLVFDGANIPEINFSDTTIISNGVSGTLSSLHSITTGNALVDLFDITTQANSFTLSGLNAADMTLVGDNIATLNVSNQNADISIDSNVVTLNTDIIANTLTVLGANLTDITTTGTTNISSLIISEAPLFTSLNANGGEIDLFDLTTPSVALSLDGTGFLQTNINAQNLTELTLNAGTGNVTLNNTSSNPLEINIIGETVVVNSNTTALTLHDNSNISTLNVAAPSVNTVVGNASIVDTVNINDSSSSLTFSSTNITNINVDSNITTANFTTTLSSNIDFTSTAIVPVIVNTNTSSIDLTTSSDTTLNAQNLDTVNFNVGSNNLDLVVNKTNLDLNLDGIGAIVTVNGSSVNNLNLGVSSVIEELVLESLEVSSLDLTNGTYNTITINSDLTSFTLTGNKQYDTVINGDNLNTVTVNNNDTNSSVDITTLTTSLDINGESSSVVVNGTELISVNVNDLVTSTLNLKTDKLESFDQGTTNLDTLIIQSSFNNFDLTTNTQNTTFYAQPLNILNVSSTSAQIDLTTTAKIVDISAPSTEISLYDLGLTSILGNVGTLNVYNSDSGFLTVDVTADLFNYNSNDALGVVFTGTNTILGVIISSDSVSSVVTNNVLVTTLDLDLADNAIITTSSTNVGINANSSDYVLNYLGSVPVSIALAESGEFTLNAFSTTTITVDGVTNSLIINGPSISDFTATTLDLSNKLTINNTSIDDLEFLSPLLLSNMTEIEINTLSNSITESIINKLQGSSINLISPITDTDIYNYYYNTELALQTLNEANTSARFNSIRDSKIDDAWSLINSNEYLLHLDETTTRTEISDQVYQATDDYFASYLVSIGQTEVEFGVDESVTARASIQTILDNQILVIDNAVITAQVEADIIQDSVLSATTDANNIGFTLE